MRASRHFRAGSVGTVAVTLLALLFGFFTPAAADSNEQKKKRVDAQVAELQSSLDDTSTELRQATVALQNAQRLLSAAQASEGRANTALNAARARQNDLQARLDIARRDVATSRKHLASVRSQIDSGRSAAGSIARSAYTSGQLGDLSVVMQSESPTDFVTRVVMLQSAARGQSALLDRLTTDRADVTNEGARLADAESRVSRLEKQAVAVVAARTAAEATASAARQDAAHAQSVAAVAQNQISQQKVQESARLNSMQAASDDLGNLLRKAAALRRIRARRATVAAAARARKAAAEGQSASDSSGAASDAGHSSGLQRPVDGPITSPYGMRMHPVLGILKLHDGTDFGAACGTPIHAAADGTVAWAEWLNGYGFQTGIDHGTIHGMPVATSYSHQPYLGVVHVGQFVHQGDVIGYTGQTGYATGCHVHFMVYVNGSRVDPQNGWI